MKTNSALVRVVALATIAVALTAATNVILGTAGPDNLVGTPGDDSINGRGGGDVMSGLAGNDTYFVDDEADQVVEQAAEGTDTVRTYDGWYSLPANVENLYILVTQGSISFGNGRANRMVGNVGSDAFFSGAGNDSLIGRGGRDVLVGEAGNDVLTGGGGLDEFVITAPRNGRTNVDRITDFNPEEDVIGLFYTTRFSSPSVIVFEFLTKPRLVTSSFVVGPSATTTVHRVVYNPADGTLYYDQDGSGPLPAVPFAKLSPHLALTNQHFIDYSRALLL